MSNTQIDIQGVFDKNSGKLTGFAAGMLTEIRLSSLISEVSSSYLERKEKLKLNPIGFNSYELIYRYLLSDSYSYSNMISYFVQSKANIIRVMYPCYSASEYTSLVFNNIPKSEFSDSDFKPSFLNKTQEVFDAAAVAGVKLQLCFFWWTNAVAELHNETVVDALKTTSASYAFMTKFVRWFGNKYGNHPSFGAFSFFNEQQYDVTGVTNPTPLNLGNVTSGLISEMRQYASEPVATTDFNFFSLSTNPTRSTFVSEIENIKLLAKSCDTLGVHVYGYGASQSGMSFVGSFGVATAAFTPSTSNKLGFEGLESYLTAMKSVAESLNIGLWITETGVPTDVDSVTSTLRRNKVLSLCQQYADVTLIWNAADVASPQANQIVWQIRPGTSLGDSYKTLLSSFNSGKALKKAEGVGAGTVPLRLQRQPKYCMSSVRSANATVRVTSVAAMTTANQTFMAWVRRDGALNNFENLFDCRGSGNVGGMIYLAGANASTDAEYAELRSSAASSVNTSGRLPRMQDNEWHHFAFVYRTINGQIGIEVWYDGMFWGSYAATNAYVGIPTGTVIYSCGGSTNGAPISMQDVALMNYASPEDIWAHMDGRILPQSQMHLRADNTGIMDFGRNNLAVTVGSGVTFGPA